MLKKEKIVRCDADSNSWLINNEHLTHTVLRGPIWCRSTRGWTWCSGGRRGESWPGWTSSSGWRRLCPGTPLLWRCSTTREQMLSKDRKQGVAYMAATGRRFDLHICNHIQVISSPKALRWHYKCDISGVPHNTVCPPVTSLTPNRQRDGLSHTGVALFQTGRAGR